MSNGYKKDFDTWNKVKSYVPHQFTTQKPRYDNYVPQGHNYMRMKTYQGKYNLELYTNFLIANKNNYTGSELKKVAHTIIPSHMAVYSVG